MKIALLGYGKMGKTIERLALENGHTIVFKKWSSGSSGAIEQADVAIEFSVPETAVENIGLALNLEIPVVSGTTGWLQQYDDIIKLCEDRNGALIYASNFSVGVNLFFLLNKYAAQLMSNWKKYKARIYETHHVEKQDAPSGTAISLANDIIESSDLEGWILDDAVEKKLTIKAHRKNDVKGTHEIEYKSEIDSIKLSHEAHTRDGFASGAIMAASWLIDKKGVYTMQDVLGIAH